MKTALALLVFVAAPLFAAEQNPAKAPGAPPSQSPDEVRKLKSVTWDLDSHKLVWVVQKGSVVNGDFVSASEQKYEIAPDAAAMLFEGEQRGFDGDEAASLQHLLDVLSTYCAESVVWWEEGLGTPLPPDKQAKPKTNSGDKTADPKPVRIKQPSPAPQNRTMPDAAYIAQAAR